MADASKGLREFTTDLSLYEKGRPEYSSESVEYLLHRIGVLPSDCKDPIKVLEIAAGTGKFTRAMVKVLASTKANVQIIASDSSEAMCDMFRRIVPEIEMFHFPAENIGEYSIYWKKLYVIPTRIDQELGYEGGFRFGT